MALAGLTACTPVQEKIVPYVEAPENLVPGKALFYATATQQHGYALGLLAQSTDGRPTKLEGNPEHPASRGATNAIAQATILDLYDPDRSQRVRNGDNDATWDDFLAALRSGLAAQTDSGGSGLRVLTESVTSPTLAAQMTAILAQYPNARWHHYEPINRDNVYGGTALAFGEPLEPIYDLSNAQVIVSLDADFLAEGPGQVRYARDFADGRRATTAEATATNRLYVIESSTSITGAAADHRLPLSPTGVETFARALAAALGIGVEGGTQAVPSTWIEAIVGDLQANQGSSIVIAGEYQPPAVHALAHAMYVTLGNVGQTVRYSVPILATPAAGEQNQVGSLQTLVGEMQDGSVELLLILGGNPVYNAPADLNFGEALAQVGLTVHLGLYADETAAVTTWHIPAAHELESWSDGRAYDGTVTIQQPLIEPLYGGHSIHELLDALLSEEVRSSHEIVRGYWEGAQGADGFDAFWRRTLHDGFVTESGAAIVEAALVDNFAAQLPAIPTDNGRYTLLFRPDPTVDDGRYANNGWLQELPKPLTKLTWENAALINPLTAGDLGLTTGDRVEITLNAQTVQLPVLLQPGQALDVITLSLGYGRTHAGRVGNGVGANIYGLRTTTTLWRSSDVVPITKVASGHTLAITQGHHAMEGRDLIRVGTMAEFAANPEFAHEMGAHVPEISLYPKMEYNENSWGMAVDLTACIGCNACVVACQAENNIPVVGQQQVLAGREMHWIRIDTYFEGDLENPAAHHQPVMCMHCENAPCEVVCPVAATMHDGEGLNTMVYNRCVGTRYCANNCPYKVRRFNF
ncbi:MAG: 4Fe-4S dicluster domain-containing protein [Caldilineaceae bacterium]